MRFKNFRDEYRKNYAYSNKNHYWQVTSFLTFDINGLLKKYNDLMTEGRFYLKINKFSLLNSWLIFLNVSLFEKIK
jgi:hypothetical protein